MKQPEDLTDAPRRSAAGFLVAVVLGLVLFVSVLFIPLQRCTYCGPKRQEIRDWLKDPVVKKYREEHPEAVLAAQDDLDRIDKDCRDCFHGRLTLWSELRQGILGSHR